MATVAIVPLIELILPIHISSMSRYMLGIPHSAITNTPAIDVDWAFPNRALIYPLTIPAPFTVRFFQWLVGTVSVGNFDFGIYDSNFSLLRSLGSTPYPPADTYVSNPIISLKLQPGNYFVAFVASDALARVYAVNPITTLIAQNVTFFGTDNALPLPTTIIPTKTVTNRIMVFNVSSAEF